MAREDMVRELLGLGPDDQLQERGVYRPPEMDDLVREPPGAELPGPGEVLLTSEWLDDAALEGHFSQDSTLEAMLPRGQVKRLDVEPRVLVLHGIPEPTQVEGVVRADNDRWVVDTRGEPVALVVPVGDHELILAGEKGDVRLFLLHRARGSPPSP